MFDVESKILEGISFYNEGEYEQALKVFQDVLTLRNIDLMTLFYLGNTLGSLSRFDEAIDTFDKMLSLDPKNAKALKAKDVFENLEINSLKTHTNKKGLSFPDALICSPSPVASLPNQSQTYPESSKDESPKDEDTSYFRRATDINTGFGTGDAGTMKCFLDASEIERFLNSGNIKNLDIQKIVDNIGTNSFDKEVILDLIRSGDVESLKDFINKVQLRNKILDYLADSNILAPRKYNTITTQIININAEFGLAFLMFNLGEFKYNNILLKLGEKISTNFSDNNTIKADSEKIGMLKIIANFFIGLFSFEKAFANEGNKLSYFKYLFMFLGFISVLVLVGYGIKNEIFKADIKSIRTTTASGTTESVTEIKSNM